MFEFTRWVLLLLGCAIFGFIGMRTGDGPLTVFCLLVAALSALGIYTDRQANQQLRTLRVELAMQRRAEKRRHDNERHHP